MKKNSKLLGVVGVLSIAAVALAAKCILLYKDNQNLLDLMKDDEDDWEDEEDDIFEDEDSIHLKKEDSKEEEDTDSPKIGENTIEDENDKASSAGM